MSIKHTQRRRIQKANISILQFQVNERVAILMVVHVHIYVQVVRFYSKSKRRITNVIKINE